jgi:hypothetical protein
MVDLSVYNLYGTKVKNILSGTPGTGSYRIPVSSGDLPSGIYIVVLSTEQAVYTRKMMIVK